MRTVLRQLVRGVGLLFDPSGSSFREVARRSAKRRERFTRSRRTTPLGAIDNDLRTVAGDIARARQKSERMLPRP